MKKVLHGHVNLLSDVSNLIIGVALAQIIPLLLQPLLKRIYSPEDFGAFDFYYKIVGILFVLYSFKYDVSIVLPKDKKVASNLYVACIVLALFSAILTWAFIILIRQIPIEFIELPSSYERWIFLIPLSVLFISFTNSTNYLLIRNKLFRGIAVNKFFRRVTEGIFQAPIGYYYGNPVFLPLGDLIGSLGSFLSGLFLVSKNKLICIKDVSVKNIHKALKDYSDLPKYSLVPNLLNIFVLSSLTFQTLKNFSLVEVGYLELTQKILMIPSAIVASAVSKVVLQRVAEANSIKKSIKKELKVIFLFLLVITTLYSLMIVLFAPKLFSIIFGNTWIHSGKYAQILVCYTGISFVISPLGQILIGLKKIKTNSKWEIIKFCCIGSLYFISFSDIKLYLYVFSLINIFLYLLYGYLIIREVRRYEISLYD